MYNTTQENTTTEKEATDPLIPRETRSRRSSHRRKRTVEINSLDQLTFESFYYSDMNLLDAKIVSTNSKMFGPTVYIVEIKISNIPPFKVPRRFNEFHAFHTALKERFSNVKWPEFPNKFQIMGKTEARKNAFNKLLEKVIELVRMKETPRKYILIIFYRFFLDTEAANKYKAEASSKKNNPTKQRTNSEGDEEDEGEAKNIAEDLKQAVSDFEDKFKNLDNGERADTLENDDEKLSARSLNEAGSLEESKSALQGTPKKGNNEYFSENGKDLYEEGKEDLKRDGSMLEDPFIGSDSPNRDKKLISSVLDFQNDEPIDGGNRTEVLDGDSEISPDTQEKLMKSLTSDDGNLSRSSSLLQSSLDTPLSHSTTQPSTQKKNDLKNTQTKEAISQMKAVGKALGKAGLDMFNKYTKKTKAPSNGNINLPTTTTQAQPQPQNPQPSAITDVGAEKSTDKALETPEEDQNIIIENRERAVAVERPSISLGEKKDMAKFLHSEVYGFAGSIHMKLSSEKKWAKYFAKIAECFILLHRSILDNYPIHIICVYAGTIIQTKTEDGREYLELFHYYDNEKMEICIDPALDDQNDSIDPYKNLKVWYNQIKIATTKTSGLVLNQVKYNPIGKCQLAIADASGLKGLPNNSTFYIRLGHIPYYLKTTLATKSPSAETLDWKQIFYIPLCDPFFSITLDLVGIFNDGWITEHQREQIFGTGEISVPDILRLGKGEVLVTHVALKYTEPRRKAIAKALNINEGDVQDPMLKVKIRNLSSFKALFAPSMRDHFEGIKMDKENYSQQYFKLGFRRIYRIIAQVKIYRNYISDIFNFKYPMFSTICFFLLTWFIITFDVSTFLPDFLLLLVLMAIYKAPIVKKHAQPFLEKYFFDDSHLNPFYQKPCVVTAEDQDIKKFMNTAKWKEKFRNEESLVTTFKKAKKSLATMTIVLNSFSSFFEKLKNIISWEDPTRTASFIVFLMFTYCALYTIGLRTMFLLAVWASFAQGVSFYKVVYTKNKELARGTLNFIVKRYFPEHSNTISTNMTLPWPHTINFNSFQRKLLEQLLYRLSIILPEDALLTYKTPEELITAIATCPRVLAFFKEPAEEAILENNIRKEPKFGAANIIYFLLNVPSDYYRVIHPRLT